MISNHCLARNEVLTEVVHVLLKFYKIERSEVNDLILTIIDSGGIEVENEKVIRLALAAFCERKLDFVDCLLYAYSRIEGSGVFTFDKALKKLVGG